MTVTEALYDRLADDGTLTALLATYSGSPAIFTADPIPEDAVAPFIVIHGTEDDEPFDTKDCVGRDVRRMVRCYTAATGSVLAVEAIAERARALLHRLPVGLATGAFIATCSGPVDAPTDNDFYGQTVTVRLVSMT